MDYLPPFVIPRNSGYAPARNHLGESRNYSPVSTWYSAPRQAKMPPGWRYTLV